LAGDFGRKIDGRKMFRGGTRFLFIYLPSIFLPQFFGGTEVGQTTAAAVCRFLSVQDSPHGFFGAFFVLVLRNSPPGGAMPESNLQRPLQ
jgi:hypothetical protein